jgi:hypothetical protein
MTVDLQIRTVQLDSDDQGLVEALGMPRALLDEMRSPKDLGAHDKTPVNSISKEFWST